ncbi:MAG: hypothetical protein JW768_03770 [Chitinispirillaceae bacterium]|nr:hypothetical protein [Chitinispirillaceae bacterium]
MADYLPAPSAIRRGRFLWMAEPAQKEYLNRLKDKIEQGYYFSDSVFRQIAEDLAPLYVESTGVE